MTLAIAPTSDLETCLGLRNDVFVMEQDVPLSDDQDGRDTDAIHVLACLDGQPVGTARILVKGETGKIGRVCVSREARGDGVGSALIKACVQHLRHMKGVTRAELGAQIHALKFYEQLGFAAYGPVYDDVGIPHRDMECVL